MEGFLTTLNGHLQSTGILLILDSPSGSGDRPNEIVLDSMLKCIQENFLPIVNARLKAENEEKKRNPPLA